MNFRRQNLVEDKNGDPIGLGLKHGRAWLQNGSLQLHWEWFFGKLSFRLGIESEEDDDLLFSFCIPLVSIWFSVTHPFIHKCLKRTKWFYGRQLGVSIHDGSVWIDFLTQRFGEWPPAVGKHYMFDFVKFILGKTKYSKRVLKEFDVEIPMPERIYTAKVEESISTRKRPRWPQSKKQKYFSFDIAEGIPIPGKGENAWDCGDDAILGISSNKYDIGSAIGEVVGCILQRRLKYGSKMRWDKPPSSPVNDLNVKEVA